MGSAFRLGYTDQLLMLATQANHYTDQLLMLTAQTNHLRQLHRTTFNVHTYSN